MQSQFHDQMCLAGAGGSGKEEVLVRFTFGWPVDRLPGDAGEFDHKRLWLIVRIDSLFDNGTEPACNDSDADTGLNQLLERGVVDIIDVARDQRRDQKLLQLVKSFVESCRLLSVPAHGGLPRSGVSTVGLQIPGFKLLRYVCQVCAGPIRVVAAVFDRSIFRLNRFVFRSYIPDRSIFLLNRFVFRSYIPGRSIFRLDRFVFRPYLPCLSLFWLNRIPPALTLPPPLHHVVRRLPADRCSAVLPACCAPLLPR